jgi:hypothetical protein
MNESIRNIETGTERTPNEREVLNYLEGVVGKDFEIKRSLENEEGLYLLQVESTDEAGDLVVFTYQKAGKYKEGSSNETVIDVVYYMGEMPVGGDTIAKYHNGNWTKI